MTNADQPLVSVVVTTFNSAAHLEEALAGIAAQDYEPLEVVVHDNASTDDTLVLVDAFRARS